MPGLLPQIDYPDSATGGLNAYAKAYGLGQEQRQQNALSQAGEALASGDQTGARNALYQSGQVDAGLKLEDHFRQTARQATADQLAKAQRVNDVLGELALAADTPEKWAVSIGVAKKAGLDVDKYADFGTRNFVLAQGKKTSDWLNMEAERRKQESDAALKQQAIDAKAAAASRPKPRALGLNDTNKLAEKGSTLDSVNSFNTDFKDEYAGYSMGGETAMLYGRNAPSWAVGSNTEQAANFWQGYDRYKNKVRNELFGSALTAQEKAAFEAADVNANMRPDLIKKNLARQQKIVNTALGRVAKSMVASGYNQEAIETAIGKPLQDLGVEAPSGGGGSAGGGGSLDVGAELDEDSLESLPEGAVIRAENGQRYKRQGNHLVPVR